jgi:hypothetical protein
MVTLISQILARRKAIWVLRLDRLGAVLAGKL